MSQQPQAQQTNDSGALDASINAKIQAGFQDLAERLDLPELEVTAQERRGSLRRAAYLTASIGLVFAFLFTLTFLLARALPGPAATDQELVTFYGSSAKEQAIIVGTYVMPFTGIAFLWFIVALRMWISASVRRVSDLTSNLQLLSGILFIGLFFVGAGAIASTAVSIEFLSGPLTPQVARQLPQFGIVIILVFANRMAAIFVFTTSTIGRSSKIMPNWFAYLGYAVGLFLLLSSAFSAILAMVFPIWLTVLCIILFVRARRIPADAVLPRRGQPTSKPTS